MNANKKKGGFEPPSRCYFLQHGQWQSPLQLGPQQPLAAAIEIAPPTRSAVKSPRLVISLLSFFITILLF